MTPPELSFVIPVYNGAGSVGAVVERIHELYPGIELEVVLVNDGSRDASERVCAELARRFPDTVTFVHLARNFGEHGAVLAGLHETRGRYVAVLDDDGQNPPEEVRRLYEAITGEGYDVVYGRYRVKHHSWLRNLGSRFNDRVANVMLGKPPGLYLSSFKIMNRFLVDEITRYKGAFPYIDGLVLRATGNLGQIDVDHRERDGESTYTFRKLVHLWLNMFLNFSITPLRVSALLGMATSLVSLFLLVAIVVDKLYAKAEVTAGIPTVLVVVVFFAGIQLVILGTIGEYLGRLFLDHSNAPQFVVRYVKRGGARDG
ncbi:MAG TPA: glycosyltransferase family 2 protein [Candidatus Polarisedimenticolaceae bacterium]|nr:glycosyltransferase family 2 protein [Candidatus Polarisedimenticolaceae bacterium]